MARTEGDDLVTPDVTAAELARAWRVVHRPTFGSHERRIRERLSVGPVEGAPSDASVERTVIIGFTNRSGSNLLARFLVQGFGVPLARERFNWPQVLEVADRIGASDLAEVTRFIAREGSSDGTLTVKLGASQLAFLTDIGHVPSILRNPVLLWIGRRDLVAQAVSFSIAEQSGRWTSTHTSGAPEPTFDLVDVVERCRGIAMDDALFEVYASVHDLPVHRIWYEDLLQDPDGQLEPLGPSLGRPYAGVSLDEIDISRQSTHRNEGMIAAVRTALSLSEAHAAQRSVATADPRAPGRVRSLLRRAAGVVGFR